MEEFGSAFESEKMSGDSMKFCRANGEFHRAESEGEKSPVVERQGDFLSESADSNNFATST